MIEIVLFALAGASLFGLTGYLFRDDILRKRDDHDRQKSLNRSGASSA